MHVTQKAGLQLYSTFHIKFYSCQLNGSLQWTQLTKSARQIQPYRKVTKVTPLNEPRLLL